MPSAIQFECPQCAARHSRGYLDGVSLFRCLHCGYMGHGFHPDPQIDNEVLQEWLNGNAFNRTHGIPEMSLEEALRA
jgi:rubredoxin